MPTLPSQTANPNDCWAPTPNAPNGCWPFNTEQYYDCDLALLKLNISTGAVLYSKDVGRSVAVDNWAFMARSGSTLYVLASAFVVDNNNSQYNEKILGSVIKVDDQATANSFAIKWRKDSDVQVSFEFCPFGICMAQDGGVVMCGNNHCNGDDYELIKIASDCQANTSFTTSNTTVNQGQTLTWNTPKSVKGTVRVKAGGHLIIQNNIVNFANTYLNNDWYKLRDGVGIPSKIIVEEGGKLTLDGCMLTGLTSCGRDWMWEGIEVYGNPSLSPSTTNQGLVIMKNNAVVKNAYRGIVAGDSFYDSQGRSVSTGTKGGGLVQSDQPLGSTTDHFVNCRRSVWFAPYPYTGSAYNAPVVFFKNTNFKASASNYSNDVNLVDANGIGLGMAFQLSSWNRDFITCTNTSFRNTVSGLPETSRGIGVDGYDARITLNTSNFDGLYRGVYLNYGVGVTDRLNMTTCTLKNTRHNIEVNGGAFHSIQTCNINSLPAGLMNDPSYGIKFTGATNLYCSGNVFNGTATATYGIITENSGTNASEFFNNTFQHVDFGTQTQQFNTGLQIRCNSYTGQNNAWSINPQSPGSGQLSPQGVCDNQYNQAGNVFNDPTCATPGSSEVHIKSNVPFAYRSRNSASFPLELPTCVTQPNITVTVDNCNPLSTNANSCINSGCNGCKPGQTLTESEYDQSVWAEQMAVNFEVGKMLDEGNDEQVPELIRKGFPEDKTLFICALINIGKWEEARIEIESLSTMGVEKETRTVCEILLNMAEQKQPGLSIDNEAQLIEVAKSASQSRYLAMNILEHFTGLRFEHPIEVWEKTENETYSEERNDVTLTSHSDKMVVFPNPTYDRITVRCLDAPVQKIYLMDLVGRKLIDENVNDFEKEMQVGHLQNGMYLLHVECENKSKSFKLVIQH